MRNGRYIQALLVVGLLLSVTFTTSYTVGTGDEEQSPPREETIGVECLLITDGETFHTQQRISLEDALVIRDLCIKAAIAFKIMSLFLPQEDTASTNGFMNNQQGSPYAKEILINNTEARVNDLSSILKQTGILPPTVPGLNMMSLGLLPGTGLDVFTPVLSLGIGYGWIPNYNGEALLGFMMRPIFLTYLLGYTGSLNFVLLPPRVSFWDKFGPHVMSIMGFAGLYIKFGELGTGIFPIQVVMGECFLLAKSIPQTMTTTMGQSVVDWLVNIILRSYIQRNFSNIFP